MVPLKKGPLSLDIYNENSLLRKMFFWIFGFGVTTNRLQMTYYALYNFWEYPSNQYTTAKIVINLFILQINFKMFFMTRRRLLVIIIPSYLKCTLQCYQLKKCGCKCLYSHKHTHTHTHTPTGILILLETIKVIVLEWLHGIGYSYFGVVQGLLI